MSYEYYVKPEEYQRASEHGVSSRLLDQRVRVLAWDKERAITTPPRKEKDHKHWPRVAKQNGICYQTYLSRINNHGWSPERAATQSLQDKNEWQKSLNEGRRVFPPEIVDLAARNGICYPTFRSRVKEFGWDLVKAATKPPTPRTERNSSSRSRNRKGLGLFFGRK